MEGVEYLEIIPSVNPITETSFGTILPILFSAFIAVTAKSSFTAKTASNLFLWIKFSISCVQFSIFSILRIKLKSTGRLFLVKDCR